VAAVARQAGIPDLHAFNRFLRRETGAGPRRWRGASGGAGAATPPGCSLPPGGTPPPGGRGR
jgi:hypothetical protein